MDLGQLEVPIQQELTKLLELLEKNEVIQRYQKLEKQTQQNKKLTALVEQIKEAQKEAVQYAHYDKPEAEKLAIQQADKLKIEFDTHPLVIAYREQLIEANDLLHHIANTIQFRVNEELEKEE